MRYRFLLLPWFAALVLCATCLAMQGCGPDLDRDRDNCLYQAQFRECMELLPAGPQRTHYNDWDEVVGACSAHAYEGTWRPVTRIPSGCR